MEIKTLYTKENKLFNRKEMGFAVDFSGITVSKEDAKREICKTLSLNPEGLVITRIDQKAGIRQCKITAHYYNDAKDISKREPAYLLKRLEKKTGKGEAEKKEEKKTKDENKK